MAIAIVMGAAGDRALASHVNCGDKVTADTRLDSDLHNCRNNGIVIGADDVTLNLDGHTIDGDGKLLASCPRDKICDAGVVSAGHDGVTVRGGSVREFAVGVLVGGARRNRVLAVSSSGNRFPGIVIFNSARSVVRDSKIARNGLHTDEAGIVVFHSHQSRIVDNSIRENGDIGMIIDGSGRSSIQENLIIGNPEAGVIIDAGRNEVSRNRVARNGDGIIVGGNRNTIVRNRVSGSRAGQGGGGFGISFETGSDNLIARNLIVRSSTAGIRVGLSPADAEGGPPAANTVIRGNRLGAGNRDGVFVMSTAVGIALRHNRAHDSGDDGFDVESPATRLTDNSAIDNGGRGIEAVRGVADGGGNIAQGNGDVPECTNIACG